MRISDWSSDVCSSDLQPLLNGPHRRNRKIRGCQALMQAAPLPDRIARNLSENSHCPPSPGYIQAPAGHSLWTPRRWADQGTRHDNWQQNLHPNPPGPDPPERSEEHTSELQSPMRSSYADFCLKT